ncbi:hypothetical protein C484_00275 [Natrialba taiwanensis DSM 12281]|uniref:Uncharacterized protein n=1 Tax=Natrialba taiwanensis DSM 12281 TaxID=1230458 RepID=M0AHG4_9EURY|nr:hypothetical protein C484_00275 [Natrialba taiwanensis DSM 12281]
MTRISHSCRDHEFSSLIAKWLQKDDTGYLGDGGKHAKQGLNEGNEEDVRETKSCIDSLETNSKG